MATGEIVVDVLELLCNSGLEFTPTANLEPLAEAWADIFEDVPDKLLIQAAKDYLKIETRFPAPAKLRSLAKQVQAHNGVSIAGDPFFTQEHAKRPTVPIPPAWVIQEELRLAREIPWALTKPHDQWDETDHANYRKTLGWEYDSDEDKAYWKMFFSYLTPEGLK